MADTRGHRRIQMIAAIDSVLSFLSLQLLNLMSRASGTAHSNVDVRRYGAAGLPFNVV
jgi:hypothetical protein